MADFFYNFLLIQLFNQIEFVVSFTRPCNASLQTVQRVSECPTNLTSYEAAARQKNCSALYTDAQSCHSFQYHCVLSEDLQHLVEVCAPSLNIIDHVCAKFVSSLKSIMRVHGMNCSGGPEECPYSYNSTHAYKYHQCYSSVSPTTDFYQSFEITSITKQKKISEQGLDRTTTLVVSISSTMICIAIIAIIVVYCLKKRKRPKKRGNNTPGTEHNQDLLPSLHQQQQQQQNDPDDSLQDTELHEDLIPPTNQQHEEIHSQDTHPGVTEKISDTFRSTTSKHIAYRKHNTRAKSFDCCKIDWMKIKAMEFAEYGFYYKGLGRTVICFHCGLSVEDLEESTDVVKKHTTLKESCDYIKHINSKLKGSI